MSNISCISVNKVLLDISFEISGGVAYKQRSFLTCCYEYCLISSIADINNYERPNVEDMIMEYNACVELSMVLEHIITELSNEIILRNLSNPVIATINNYMVTIENNKLYTLQY